MEKYASTKRECSSHPYPKKGMIFNELIFIKQSPKNCSEHFLYRIGFRSEGTFINYEQIFYILFIFSLNYNMASTAPILINLALTETRYVMIFCTHFAEIHYEIWKAQVVIYWLLPVKYSWH